MKPVSIATLLLCQACATAATHSLNCPPLPPDRHCQTVFTTHDSAMQHTPVGYALLSENRLHAQLFHPLFPSGTRLDNIKGGYISQDGLLHLQWQQGRLLLRQP